MIPKESVDASFSFVLPFRVVVATHSRRSPRSENVQTCQHSSVQTSFTPNSFPCHTSEKSPANSNHCHTSKIAKNNPCSCHTSETPRGPFCKIGFPTAGPRSVSSPPSRDEKPAPVTLLESALTNSDARKSLGMCIYENCRVSPAFFSLSALFLPRGNGNSFPFKGISTLSKNSRVYRAPSASVNSALSVGSALVPILCFDFQLLTFSSQPSQPLKEHFPSGAPRNALHWKVARHAAAPIVCPGTYAPSSPIARNRRPPQRGQVHALQPLHRHAPL